MNLNNVKTLLKLWGELKPSELKLEERDGDLSFTLTHFNFHRKMLSVPFLSPEDPYILEGYCFKFIEELRLQHKYRSTPDNETQGSRRYETLVELERGDASWIESCSSLESTLRSYCSYLARQRTIEPGLWRCWNGIEYEVHGIGKEVNKQLINRDLAFVRPFQMFKVEENPTLTLTAYRWLESVLYCHKTIRVFGDRVLYSKPGEEFGWARIPSDFLEMHDLELRFRKI